MRKLLYQTSSALRQYLFTALLSCVLAGSITYALARTIEIQADIRQIALMCAVCLCIYMLTNINRAAAYISMPVALVCLTVYALQTNESLGLLELLKNMVNGEPIALTETAAEPLGAFLVNIITILLSLFCMTTNKHREGFYPSLSITCVAALWCAVAPSKPEGIALALLPAMLALTALYAVSNCSLTSAARVLAVILAIALPALFLLPNEGITNDALVNLANKVRRDVSERINYGGQRSYFSLAGEGSSGFQPLGGGRLGGSIEPSDTLVMTVETNRTLWLRATTKDYYTGSAFTDTLGGQGMPLNSASYAKELASVMDYERPQDYLRTGAMWIPISAAVTIECDTGATTLYVPHRVSRLITQTNNALSFNMAGEVFVDTPLGIGDTYSFTAQAISLDDPTLPNLLERAAQSDAIDMSGGRRAAYLQIPRNLEGSAVFEFAEETTRTAQSPYEIVLALRDELRSWKYTLSPGDPPYGIDFVESFMNAREGYCTYFAAAMVVAGRMMGVPMRYVEGYVAVPTDDGTAYVTGKSAHAWAEAYFDGFGWITVDATPPDRQSNGDGGDNPDANEPTPSPPPPTGEQPSPTPSSPPAEPTPSPSSPLDSTDSNDARDDATPQPEPITERPPEDKNPPWMLLIVLAAILLAALIWFRSYWTEPKTAAKRRKTDDERIMVWYRAALRLLIVSGRKPGAHESPAVLSQKYTRLSPLFDGVSRSVYGNANPSAEELAAVSFAYAQEWRGMRARHRLAAWLDRMVHGAGDTRVVP
ncbi:MAG: transglutaminase domain-containing protein [Oscillospiraceae bacterium]|jgi:transglutaminase-like putative cysteine protease|nr:transglutaminase domain-containing protein [Oscillospiraceae bacterium]